VCLSRFRDNIGERFELVLSATIVCSSAQIQHHRFDDSVPVWLKARLEDCGHVFEIENRDQRWADALLACTSRSW
jgi:hypothetical protein